MLFIIFIFSFILGCIFIYFYYFFYFKKGLTLFPGIFSNLLPISSNTRSTQFSGPSSCDDQLKCPHQFPNLFPILSNEEFYLFSIESIMKALNYISFLQTHLEMICANYENTFSGLQTQTLNLKETLSALVNHSKDPIHLSSKMISDYQMKIKEVHLSLEESLIKIQGQIHQNDHMMKKDLKTLKELISDFDSLIFHSEYEANYKEKKEEIREILNWIISETENFQFHHLLSRQGEEINDKLRNFKKEKENCLTDVLSNGVALHKNINEISQSSLILFEIMDMSLSLSKKYRGKNQMTLKMAATSVERIENKIHPNSPSLLLTTKTTNKENFNRLDEIYKRGFLNIALDPRLHGLSFRIQNQQGLQGLDIEYAEAFARWLGVKCNFIEKDWEDCLESLMMEDLETKTKIDLVWSGQLPIFTWENISFSQAYTDVNYVIVKRSDNLSIMGIQDLSQKIIGVPNDPIIRDLLEKNSIGIKNSPSGLATPAVQVASIITFTNYSRILDALREGLIDVIVLSLPLFHWAATHPSSQWKWGITILPVQLNQNCHAYHVAALKEATVDPLLNKVNEFIAWYQPLEERRQLEKFWKGSL